MKGLFHKNKSFHFKKIQAFFSSLYIFCSPLAKLLFHICEKKTGLNTHEINYWQRKFKGLPLRRLDSQEMPFTFSKINKHIKKPNKPHKKEKKKFV